MKELTINKFRVLIITVFFIITTFIPVTSLGKESISNNDLNKESSIIELKSVSKEGKIISEKPKNTQAILEEKEIKKDTNNIKPKIEQKKDEPVEITPFTDDKSETFTSKTISETLNPLSLSSDGDWWNPDWIYRKQIIINHNQVEGNLTNFPVLISIESDNNLSIHAQPDGDDIVFIDNQGNKLNHEIEQYNSITGELISWVNIPILSSESDTFLYVYYGNLDATNQETISGVWDSDYIMVQHLEESDDEIIDSTSFNNDGNSTGTIYSEDGYIGGGRYYSGNDYITVNEFTHSENVLSAEAWIYRDDTPIIRIFSKGSYFNESDWVFYLRTGSNTSGIDFGINNHTIGDYFRAGNTTQDTWFHITATYNYGEVVLYLNGVKIGNSTIGDTINNSFANLGLGNDNNGGRPWHGFLDELRVSNIARNSSWVKTSYNTMSEPDLFFNIGNEEIYITEEPVVFNPVPANGETDVSVFLSQLSFNLTDYQGNSMNYSIVTVPNIGQDNANGVNNGSYHLSILGLLYDTEYFWYVNVTDNEGHWNNKTFSFRTRPQNYIPEIMFETPSNNSTMININPILSVNVTDLDEEPINVIFRSNASGTWQELGDYTGGNGIYSQTNYIMYNLNTTYYWSVHITDGKVWTNATYHFKTSDSVVLTLKWYNDTISGRTASGPLVADVTGNGRMEVIRSGENGVVVLDGETGETIWNFTETLHNDHCPVEIIDLNKDNIPEVIFSNDPGTIALHGNNGSVYWYNPDAPLYNKYCVAGDIDADGYPEVYTAVAGQITAMRHDGEIFATTYTYYPCFSGLSLGDTDGDGVFELYLNERSEDYHDNGEGKGVRAMWASNLTDIWSHPEILCSSHCPTLVDVDGDGKLDIVSCQQSGGGVIVLNSTNGNIMNYTKNIPFMGAHSQPTVHDIDNDGNLEIIVSRNSVPVIWDLVNWDYDAILPYVCKEPPAVADITGDGNVEIIACTDTNVTIFNNNYEIIGTIAIVNAHAFVVAQDVDNDGLTELVINQQWYDTGGVFVYETTAPAPNPLALSQYQFYSPHRGRSPYYTQFGPSAPVIRDETPTNGVMNYSINPELSVFIYDYQNDLMNITFKTNASGYWVELKTYNYIQNGRYYANTTDMDSIDSIYWWSVTVTDINGDSREKRYKFETTRTRPVLSNSSPKDDDIYIEFEPVLSIDADCFFGPNMNVEFWTNASGSWEIIGDNISIINQTIKCYNTNFVNEYFTKYWWSVNSSDLGTGNWTNKTFSFTTESTKVDSIIPYENINSPISISADGSENLDNVTLYHRYSKSNWTDDWKTLTSDSFEGEYFNWGNWSDAGSDCKSYNEGEYSYDGNNSIDLAYDSSTSFTQLTNGLDLDTPGYKQVKIDFWAYYPSVNSGDYLEVFFDRHSVWTFNPNLYEEQFIHHIIWVNETDYDFDDDVKIRFETEFSGRNNNVYLDQIYINASTNKNWVLWNDIDNPDDNYPWIWDFNFPEDTGYYEFYSIGIKDDILYDSKIEISDTICKYINQTPQITDITPVNNEVGISISLQDLQFTLIDYQNDTMDYTITMEPNVINGPIFENDVDSGTRISIPITSTLLDYNKTYNWHVHLTDGTIWNNKTFSFTTRSNHASWWDINWEYRREIIIDHNKVEGDLINFPIFINIISDNNIKDHTQPDGDDIVFTDIYGNKLNHEIENYDNTNGNLTAWVNVTSLSSNTDTILYLYYGNPSASNQQNVESVWDSDFISIHHFQETSGTHYDSSSCHNDTVVVNVVEQGSLYGVAGGCDIFNGSHFIQFQNNTFAAGREEITIETWINPEYITNSMTIYDEWNDNNRWQYTLRFDNFNTRDIIGGPDESRDNDISWIVSSPKSNTWNYVTTWYSVSEGEKRIYFDGSIDSFSYTNIDVLTSERNESSPRLGYASDGRNFTGKMDEFRVSKIARSTDWLKTTYNTIMSPKSFLSIGSEHIKDIYLLDENPLDYEINVEFNPILSVFIEHPSGKEVNVTFMTNVSTGLWHQIGSTQIGNNNTYYQLISDVVNYSADYYWSVNCTDQEIWVNRTYQFTTIAPPNNVPILINEKPVNGSISDILPKLEVTIDDLDNDTLSAYWYSNSSGSWMLFATNLSIDTTNGSVNISQINTDFNSYDTSYYWRVNLFDGKDWTNKTFWFNVHNDTQPPIITNIISNPEIQIINGYVNISCDVIDAGGVDTVKINITYPDLSTINETMFGTYYYNNTYSMIGTYYYFIWANDTSGNSISSMTYNYDIMGEIPPNYYSISLNVGWNLVSLPINETYGKDDIIVNYLDANYSWDQAVENDTILDFIYGWNTDIQNYYFSDGLNPGEGYWMYANQICTLWISSDVNQNIGHITDLINGWNLIGIPYNESVNKENLIVNYNGLDYTWDQSVENDTILPFIYKWDTEIHNYVFSDILESDKGYWIYANENCSLYYYII